MVVGGGLLVGYDVLFTYLVTYTHLCPCLVSNLSKSCEPRRGATETLVVVVDPKNGFLVLIGPSLSAISSLRHLPWTQNCHERRWCDDVTQDDCKYNIRTQLCSWSSSKVIHTHTHTRPHSYTHTNSHTFHRVEKSQMSLWKSSVLMTSRVSKYLYLVLSTTKYVSIHQYPSSSISFSLASLMCWKKNHTYTVLYTLFPTLNNNPGQRETHSQILQTLTQHTY